MSVSKEKKNEIRSLASDRFVRSKAALVTEYRGVAVNDLAQLRRALRKVDAEFRVVKNRVAKIAVAQDAPASAPVAEFLRGPVGVVYLYGDVAAGAKVLLDQAKTFEKLQVTGGVLDGRALGAADIQAISELPSREELLAKIVGTLVSPHRGLLQVLGGVPTQLVRVLAAIRDSKS